MGSIPGQGTKIPRAMQRSQKKKKGKTQMEKQAEIWNSVKVGKTKLLLKKYLRCGKGEMEYKKKQCCVHLWGIKDI